MSESKLEMQPLRGFANTIIVGLKVLIFCFVAISLLDTAGSFMFESYNDPNADLTNDLEMYMALGTMLMGLLTVALNLTVAVAVCGFLMRANRNLHKFNVPGLEFTPGWCAGWWFIPIANLWKPFQAVSEIYRASESPEDNSWANKEVNSVLNTWWFCWIVGTIVTRMETKLAFRGVDTGMFAIPLTWISTILMVAAGYFLIKIVRHIQLQQERNLGDRLAPINPTGSQDA